MWRILNHIFLTRIKIFMFFVFLNKLESTSTHILPEFFVVVIFFLDPQTNRFRVSEKTFTLKGIDEIVDDQISTASFYSFSCCLLSSDVRRRTLSPSSALLTWQISPFMSLFHSFVLGQSSAGLRRVFHSAVPTKSLLSHWQTFFLWSLCPSDSHRRIKFSPKTLWRHK